MRQSLKYCALAALCAALACSCDKTVPDSASTPIAFYIQAESPSTKAIVENTETLITLAPNIYVTDNAEGNTDDRFSSTAVAHTGNGIWRSEKAWTDGRNYNFYAYLASPDPVTVSAASDTQGAVSVTGNGLGATVTQPKTYSDKEDVWADYLLSYTVSANGSDRDLVRLQLERVTSCVELYMTMGDRMSSVIVEQIEFRNIVRSSTYVATKHASSTDDPALYGMKNIWSYTLGTEKTNYSFTPDQNTSLKRIGETEGRFDPKNRIMRFLAVHQPATDEDGGSAIELYVKYKVKEHGGNYHEYEATFPLGSYTPQTWLRGHKVRYYISIDSSMELRGYIAQWNEIDFIESTLLPNRPDTDTL